MSSYQQIVEERNFPVDCIYAVLVLLRDTSHRMLFSNHAYSDRTRPEMWQAQLWRAKTMSKERAAALLTTGEIGQAIEKQFGQYVDRGLLETLAAAGLLRRFRVDGDPNLHHLLTPTGEYLLRKWDSIRGMSRQWVNFGLIKQMARQAAYDGLVEAYDYWDHDVAAKRFTPKQGRLDNKTAVFGTFLLVVGAASEDTAFRMIKQASGAAWDLQPDLMHYLDELGAALYGPAYERLLLSEFESQVMWRRKQLNHACGNLLQGSKPPQGTQWKKLNGEPYVQTFYWNVSEQGDCESVNVVLKGLLNRIVVQDKVGPSRAQKVLVDAVRQSRSGDLLRQEHWREFMPTRPSYSYYEGLQNRIVLATEELGQALIQAGQGA